MVRPFVWFDRDFPLKIHRSKCNILEWIIIIAIPKQNKQQNSSVIDQQRTIRPTRCRRERANKANQWANHEMFLLSRREFYMLTFVGSRSVYVEETEVRVYNRKINA